MEVCMMGRDDGSLLSGGEGVQGRIVLTFFFTRLESWGLCSFRCFLGFSLLGGIGLNLSPYT